MSDIKKGYWADRFWPFSSQLFPFHFISLVRLPTPTVTSGRYQSDIFPVELTGLHWYEAAGGAAWLETSHAALIAWEWAEKPVGIVKRSWEKKRSNLWLLIRREASLHFNEIRRGEEMWTGGGRRRGKSVKWKNTGNAGMSKNKCMERYFYFKIRRNSNLSSVVPTELFKYQKEGFKSICIL